MPNYYQILEVETTASSEEIKKAYKRKMMQHHPDKNKGDLEATEETQKIVEAYLTLSNSKKKKIYDSTAHEEVEPKPKKHKSADAKEQELKKENLFSSGYTPTSEEILEELKDFFKKAKSPDPLTLAGGKDRKVRNKTQKVPTWKLQWENAIKDKHGREYVKTFENLLRARLMHISTEKEFTELRTFFREKKNELQASIQLTYDLIGFFPRGTETWITEFDSSWLKQLPDFNSNFIGRHLSGVHLDDYKIILDHIGYHWLVSNIRLSDLSNFFNATHLNAGYEEIYTLLDYFGQDFIRRITSPGSLAAFLKAQWNSKDQKLILDCLDGNDQWIRKNINKPSQIGYMLHTLAPIDIPPQWFFSMGSEYTSGPTEPRKNVLRSWQLLLNKLGDGWRKEVFSTPGEIKSFFEYHGLAELELLSLLIAPSYLETNNLGPLDQNYNLLEALSEKPILSIIAENSTTVVAVDASEEKPSQVRNDDLNFELISALSGKVISEVLAKNVPVKTLVLNLDQYKNKPYFKAYLLALAKAYDYELGKASYHNFLNFSRDYRSSVNTLNNLVQAMYHDKPIASLSWGNQDPVLSVLHHAYRESRGSTALPYVLMDGLKQVLKPQPVLEFLNPYNWFKPAASQASLSYNKENPDIPKLNH